MLSRVALGHIEGAKQAIQEDINAVKQHPLASAALMTGTIVAARKMPKLAAVANVALLAKYAVEAGIDEYRAAQIEDVIAKEQHYEQAGKALFNLGLTGIGIRSAMEELTGNLNNKMRGKHDAPWPLLAGLVEDSLTGINGLPKKLDSSDKTQPTVNVQLSAVNQQRVLQPSPVFSALA